MARTYKFFLLALLATCSLGTASAMSIFEGRLANGTPSSTCTVSGATKCAMYYYTTLDITILNDWNLGTGFWSATAASGSAQALAESAGDLQTDFTGWFLPAVNQYRSIFNDVGNTFASLQAQFHGVQNNVYWSATEYAQNPELYAWIVLALQGGIGGADGEYKLNDHWAVAVRPGDVAAAVPEPQTYAMLMAGLGVLMAAARRRRLTTHFC